MKHPNLYFALLLIYILSACQKDLLDVNSGDSDADITFIGTGDHLSKVQENNAVYHEQETDYIWDAAAEKNIVLAGNSIESNAGDAVQIDGTIAEITTSGYYNITGTLDDGQIIVNATGESFVYLKFNGINITNPSNAPLFIESAAKTVIYLPENTDNYLADGTEYVFPDPESDEPDATLFSKDNLTIYGEGALHIKANYNDGIVSKDGLVISGGSIYIESVDDAIRGKDYLVINKGYFNLSTGGDGLKSTNEDETDLGYVYIKDGSFTLNTASDGIQAETDLLIEKGTFEITSGGGSSKSADSGKGLKAGAKLVLDDGTYVVDGSDDAIHSNDAITINAGSYDLSTADDGIHADGTVVINSGDIVINKSYEGIESAIIVINDGNIHVNSSDDGLNVAGGNDGSASGNFPGHFSNSSADYILQINGGFIAVYASGDGLDANGVIEMTAGTVIVHGPTSSNNGAIDYDISFTITGGTLVAVGSSRMAQAPGSTSSQNSILVGFGSTGSSSQMIHIEDENGSDVLTFQPGKSYQALTFSSPALVQGKTYSILLGGSSDGTSMDGFYKEGEYAGGTIFRNFEISGITTVIQ